MFLLLRLLIVFMIAHLSDTGQKCYVAADLAWSLYHLNFMRMCLAPVQQIGPFGLISLMLIVSLCNSQAINEKQVVKTPAP